MSIQIHSPKKRVVIVLNSHSLSDLQQCSIRYRFSERLKIVPDKDYRPFSRGTIITNLLGMYYWMKKVGTYIPKKSGLDIIDKILKPSELSKEDKDLIGARFLRYLSFYAHETWEPKAVEKIEEGDNEGTGFSKIIYEDDHVLFVWEGTPDMIVNPGKQFDYLAVVDHKSQSRRTDIFEHTNQFRGYCWGTGLNHCIINYFGIQKGGTPKDWFRRKIVHFNNEKLELWKNDTIQWFYRAAFIIRNKKYMRSWQCEGKYGICHYIDLCTSAHMPFVVKDKIRRQFKKKDRVRSW